MSFWGAVRSVLKEIDIAILVLDARMPELSWNKELEKLVYEKRKIIVLVFNKCDLIDKKEYFKLKERYPKAFLVSGIKNLGISNLKKGILILAKREGIENPKIGIVGYPNVGKSAIINALAKRARAKVSSIAGTTKGIQWVRTGGLMILDSPGVIPYGDKETKLALLSAKNPEKIKNLLQTVLEVISTLIIKNKIALEKFYGVELEDNDPYKALNAIGKKRGHLIKGGEIDEYRTCLQIIRDWQNGRLII